MAAAAYLYLFVRVQWRIGDEGDMFNGALAVSRGLVPYRDFYDLRGPLSFYWLGLFFKLFGARWIVARIHLLLTGVMTSVLVYHLTRRVTSGVATLLPCAYVTVLSIPLWPASHHHWDSNLFAVAAVAAFMRGLTHHRRPALIAAGVLAALTSCFIYQKGGLLLISFLALTGIAHWRQGKDRSLMPSIGALLIGYLGVGLVVLAWFFYLGALDDFIRATVTIPLNSYADQNRVPYGYNLIGAVLGMMPLNGVPQGLALANAVTAILPVVLIAAAPFLMVGLLVVRLLDRGRNGLSLATIEYCTIAVALWVSEFHRRDIMHLIYGCPVLLIALTLLWQAVDRRRTSRMVIAASVTIPLVLLAINLGVNAAGAQVRVATRRGEILLKRDDAALRFLLSGNVTAGDYVFVYPYYSQYYFLADVRNPTRFGEMLYGPGSESYFREAIDALDAKRVKYVLWDTLVSSDTMKTWFPAYREPSRDDQLMERYLERQYDQVALLNGFRILRRKGVGGVGR